MTAPDDVRACPFCGNAKMEIHHNTQAGITFLLCGDDRGRGGCGAVVSFRPNLTGSKAIQAYNRRAAQADLSGEVRELVEALDVARGKVNHVHLSLANNRVVGGSFSVDDETSCRWTGSLNIAGARLDDIRRALAKHTHQETK